MKKDKYSDGEEGVKKNNSSLIPFEQSKSNA